MKPRLRRRCLLAAVLCGAGACAATTRSTSAESDGGSVAVGDTLRDGPPDVDLTGAWVTGTVGEPATARLVRHVECNYGPAFWSIQQQGDTIRAWTVAESRAQGVATPRSASVVPGLGRIAGSEVRIARGSDRWVLHYDSTSGHLRGTLNGAPFWAVRLHIVRPEVCIPVP